MEKDIKKTEAEIVTFEAAVKSNKRKLAQQVRMYSIWIVVGLGVIGAVGFGCWYVNKKEDNNDDKQFNKVEEGGERDDLFHRV